MAAAVGAPKCLSSSMSAKAAVSQRAAFLPAQRAVQQRRGSLQIQNAISRQRKEETVQQLEGLLQSSAVVVGLRYQGLTVKQLQEFRRSLPKESKVLVCKNTLMRVAVDKVEGWENLKPATKGDNAWLFVNEEVIADSMKAYVAFEKKLVDALPKEERATARPIDISGGVMDGKLMDYLEVKKLEKLPTKLELIATIARLINQVPTKVARGINQVPTKLAYGVKALADGDDNKELKVSDVFPKAA
ncbi:50S ribosomal L10 [Chlorella sorokiniana]|jgi:large subunit ribosomal protein L10|uniref:50S ribosomal L10 n=1 Tax=Chlorella sorokiniana TaxID=3076 RepID=A0A2P6TQ30_CHLSO|nr:50S ribosomal L10 [Chlorella sorokiniana]|eukprot:PRW56141.1 50S ribosomal L10 [Chlorella sorokiniana]